MNQEFFDEIAGILEYDAGMPREDAENTAQRIIDAIQLETLIISTIDESGTL